MIESKAQVVNVTMLTTILVLFSTNSVAEIYKWRDNRGIVQYSDKPPKTAIGSLSQATRTEVVNALQKKDVCIVDTPEKKLSLALNSKSSNSTISANFFGFGTPRSPAANNSVNPIFSIFNKATANTSATRANTPAPNVSRSSPLANQVSGAIRSGGTNITVFGIPVSRPKLKSGLTAFLPTSIAAIPAAISPTAAAPAPSTPAPTAVAPAPNTPTISTANVSPNNIVQSALMPAVDISKNMPPAIGYSTQRIQPTTELPAATSERGAFRVTCTPSHMSNDDPLVYPNQPGAAHHHTFFGNTSTNAKSDLNNLDIVGNSTCTGGSMNHSAYWVPSMIDTANNQPIKPDSAIFYYKSWAIPDQYITKPPKGLRMITGNPKATTGATSDGRYSCVTPSTGNGTPWTQTIPNCSAGTFLLMQIMFPQCWDGVNLDSPNHKDHMAQADLTLTTANKCPASHPVAIPSIALSINFNVVAENQTKNWRLASDNYANSTPGGYSAHADWVNGWDQTIMTGFVKNCLNKALDCHAHLLGDGRMFY